MCNVSSKVSVIIPSSDGSRGGNVSKLLDDISKQTIQPLDMHIVEGVSPVGRARNEGIKQANGNIVFFFDDDVRLGHDRIIEYLIEPLCHDATIVMTGASIQIPEGSSWFQRAAAKQMGRSQFPIVDKMVESDMVTTACCAISRRIFDELGDFNEVLLRGEDPEFRHRIRQAGYKIVIIPHSWFYHPMPETFGKLLGMSFRNGKSSAYGRRVAPKSVFETPDQHVGSEVRTRPLWKRTLRFGWKFLTALVTLKWIKISTQIAYFIGYIWELISPTSAQ